MRILGTYQTAYGTTLDINVSGSAIAIENMSNYVLQCSLPPAQYFYVGPQQGRAVMLPPVGSSGQLTVKPIDPTGALGAGIAYWYINEYDGSDQIPVTPWGVTQKPVTAIPVSPLAHTRIWTDWPYVYGSLSPHSPPAAGNPPPFVAIKNLCLSLSPNMQANYTSLGAMTFAGFDHYLITPDIKQAYDCVISFPELNPFLLLAINDTGCAGLASADSGGTIIVNGTTITDFFLTFWNNLNIWPKGQTTTPTLNWWMHTQGTPINYAIKPATTTANGWYIDVETLYYTGW